ncbi:MAG: hypothetical protein ACYC27_14260 [Armatimonadota bacterium]
MTKYCKICIYIITLIIIAIGSIYVYKLQKAKAVITSYMLSDTILTEEVFKSLESPGTTLQDASDKAKQSVKERESIIRKIRLIQKGPYNKQVKMLLDLLDLENDTFRALSSCITQYVDYQVADENRSNAIHDWQSAASDDDLAPESIRDIEKRNTNYYLERSRGALDKSAEKAKVLNNLAIEGIKYCNKWIKTEIKCHKRCEKFIGTRKLDEGINLILDFENSIKEDIPDYYLESDFSSLTDIGN